MSPGPKTFVKDWRLKLALYFALLVPGLIVFLAIGPSIASSLPFGWFEFLAIAYFLVLTITAVTGELYRNRFWKQIFKV
jgi:hypothetical protein